jgi:hypothetical protein
LENFEILCHGFLTRRFVELVEIFNGCLKNLS